MNRTVSRSLGLISSTVVAATMLSVAPSAHAAPRLLDCFQTNNSRSCSYMTQNIVDNKTVGYRDSITNSRSYAIEGSCEASTQKTSSYSIGSSLGTEIKAGIFGGVKAEVNSNIEKSMSSGFATSAKFKIPSRDTVYCDRGIVNERIKGYTKTDYFGGGAGTIKKNWTFQAPARLRWWIY